MVNPSPIDLGWLVRLRWGGYAGGSLLVVAAKQWAHLDLHVGELLVICGVGLVSNAGAHFWLRRRSETAASLTLLLGLDVLLLSLGLASSGGLATPLSLFYLVPLVIAAVTLPRWAVALLLTLVLGGLGMLASVEPELRADHEHVLSQGPEGALAAHGSTRPLEPHEHAALHLDAAWLGIWITGALVVLLVRRALVDRERHIDALRRERDRAERLAELSTLAASATHALGSPLATISVISRELERSLESRGPSDDLADVRAIRHEVERCREVLGNMANDARTGKEPESETALSDLCESARLSSREPALVALSLEGAESRSFIPRRSLQQVIASLLENASDSAPGERIELRARATASSWRIEVKDRGAIPLDPRRLGTEPGSTKPFGMGIGLFLGRAILERLGGTLELESDTSGTTAVLVLPTVKTPRNLISEVAT